MDFRTGDNITAAQLRNGVYIWEVRNPLSFKILQHRPMGAGSRMIVTQIRLMFNHGLKKALQMHKCFLDLKLYHYMTATSGMILSIFRNQLFRYLNNLGVISIGNVLSGASHILYEKLHLVEDVSFTHNVQYKLY
uniref:Replication enhancer n=1 Tax=Horsegram yellow mosaic virus TaxID=263793 RepID=B7ZFQ4_9GEMI|nr:replication enhanced protein [Horsegram yellow mosaic virus]QHD57737.1 replication enhancer protein [Horsegram yellow mosaic virus]QHD57770.1 replication enhancer protein [Horsegram yellow mosaic virus]UOW59953.1 replication enhancer protein [Horsegram yellow mosaic virus]UVJ88634.1 replication enhancer protein [Horsegram yellow mosaic virus]